jgi:GR25 family glycosyltransferase involved in LPS biosynthesis
MKAYIVYVKNNEKSEYYANYCLDSCKDKFDAELFEGVTPDTLSDYEKIYDFDHISPSRAENFNLQDKNLYSVKKSCFMNHVRLWNLCLETNQPLAFIEQDSFCVRAWDSLSFEDVLILNYESAWNQKVFTHLRRTSAGEIEIKSGKNLYNKSPLRYKKVNIFESSSIMPGTAAYAVMPSGAAKLLSSLEKHGWEQSDFFINTYNVKIEYYQPEYFTFKLPNLNMSHGNFINERLKL